MRVCVGVGVGVRVRVRVRVRVGVGVGVGAGVGVWVCGCVCFISLPKSPGDQVSDDFCVKSFQQDLKGRIKLLKLVKPDGASADLLSHEETRNPSWRQTLESTDACSGQSLAPGAWTRPDAESMAAEFRARAASLLSTPDTE